MITSKPHLLTAEGYKQLSDELHFLQTEKREEVANRLHNAFEDGQDDEFVESAELEAARNELSFLEGRIQKLEDILSNYQIISETNGPHETVRIGDWITVTEEGFDEDERYHLVGPAEADPSRGKISVESPLGKALLGVRVGELVKVNAPNGILNFRIVEIG